MFRREKQVVSLSKSEPPFSPAKNSFKKFKNVNLFTPSMLMSLVC